MTAQRIGEMLPALVVPGCINALKDKHQAAMDWLGVAINEPSNTEALPQVRKQLEVMADIIQTLKAVLSLGNDTKGAL